MLRQLFLISLLLVAVPTTAQDEDPLKLLPKNYQLKLENDYVRVIHVKYGKQFSYLYSEPVTAVPDVIPALFRREEHERRGDERQHMIERSWSRGPEERFQFGEGLLDRIEVGTVRWQKADLRADSFDGGADLRLFVHGEIVEHHHIAGP